MRCSYDKLPSESHPPFCSETATISGRGRLQQLLQTSVSQILNFWFVDSVNISTLYWTLAIITTDAMKGVAFTDSIAEVLYIQYLENINHASWYISE